ncbi:MAG: alpha/beta fold hydrolase [Lutibacter sp.]
MKIIKKILKIIGILLIIGMVFIGYQFNRISTPKSDQDIVATFKEKNVPIFLQKKVFKGRSYRLVSAQQQIDTVKPTIVFVHGSIGSALDFKNYLLDAELRKRANLITYDRVGYGIYNTGKVFNSILLEKEMLEDIVKNIPTLKLIIVGYSYGGPIALASLKKYKKIILLAPAVYSKYEKQPWLINFYKWKLTRFLVPKTWQAASIEKLNHANDLSNFENQWTANPSKIICVQGNDDWIVPFENSLKLKNDFPKEQFELKVLKNAGHALIWTHFKEIKKIILNQL